MKILITGSEGQLGNSFKKIADNYEHDFTFTDIEELDVTSEEETDNYLKAGKFDFIINCAAYTAVDNAENDYDKAFALNTTAPYLLAKYSKKYKTRFIHISTDYVFDGKSSVPYTPQSDTNPKSIYGTTKLQGEKKIQRTNKDAKIIRTSWLYSEFGNNFVKTMLKLGATKSSVNVVYDQIGTPTYATDLAKVIMKMTEHMPIDTIFHFSNEGVCSWYDFAKKIMEIKGLKCKVQPILTKDYPTIAKRPAYSVLDKSDIKLNLRLEIPHWEDSLRECLETL
ncbi:MAG: dTDP-4-dehydrorhamnose reductase [Bacteroidales bacterium]|nr:dTDP-4-dehydrorhamnose reductase [Bacteroidales bacterium]